jgi:hypothetical protein
MFAGVKSTQQRMRACTCVAASHAASALPTMWHACACRSSLTAATVWHRAQWSSPLRQPRLDAISAGGARLGRTRVDQVHHARQSPRCTACRASHGRVRVGSPATLELCLHAAAEANAAAGSEHSRRKQTVEATLGKRQLKHFLY